MRFLRRSGSQDRYWRPLLRDADLRKLDKTTPLVDGTVGQANIRNGLNVGVDLKGTGSKALIGYRALKFADVLDVEKRGHNKRDFWEPIYASKDDRLILQPNEFYILASRERIQVPPEVRRRSVIPIDPMMPGEFRASLRRLLRSGLRRRRGGRGRLEGGAGRRARWKVRSAPEHGQTDRAAWSTRSWPTARPRSTGRASPPTTRARGSSCPSTSGEGTGGRLRGRISASQEPGARRGPVRAGRRLCHIRGRLLG